MGTESFSPCFCNDCGGCRERPSFLHQSLDTKQQNTRFTAVPILFLSSFLGDGTPAFIRAVPFVFLTRRKKKASERGGLISSGVVPLCFRYLPGQNTGTMAGTGTISLYVDDERLDYMRTWYYVPGTCYFFLFFFVQVCVKVPRWLRVCERGGAKQ